MLSLCTGLGTVVASHSIHFGEFHLGTPDQDQFFITPLELPDGSGSFAGSLLLRLVRPLVCP